MSYCEPWKNEGPWKQILALQTILYVSFGLACGAIGSGDWIEYATGKEGLLYGTDVFTDVFFVGTLYYSISFDL